MVGVDLVAKKLSDNSLDHFGKQMPKKMLIWPESVHSSRPTRTIMSDENYIHEKLLNEHKQLESQGEVMSQATTRLGSVGKPMQSSWDSYSNWGSRAARRAMMPPLQIILPPLILFYFSSVWINKHFLNFYRSLYTRHWGNEDE